MDPQISNHAKVRFRQRGITDRTLSYIFKYGKVSRAAHGANKYEIFRKDIGRIVGNLKRDIQLLDKVSSVILIEKDGVILTGYHSD